MKIVISVPVHEKPEVIMDQIANFQYYVPGSIVILHINKQFYNRYSDCKLRKIKNVIINPEHLEIQWGDIIEAHISNYKYLREKEEKFDYWLFHASNDMYICKGISQYMSNYKAGFFKHYIYSDETLWWPGKCALKDKRLQEIMKQCGQTEIVASQIEGSFYRKDIMDQIFDILLNKHYDKTSDIFYPREEVYFSTIAEKLISEKERGYPTNFSEVHQFDRMDWTIRLTVRKILMFFFSSIVRWYPYEIIERYLSSALFKTHFYDLRIKTIIKIKRRDIKFLNKNKYLYDGVIKYQLYSSELFSVKRVKRDFNNAVRVFIRKSMGDEE